MKIKIHHKQKTLTLGEFIASVYDDAHSKYKARGIVHLVLKAHLVEYRSPQRFGIS